MFYLLLQHQTCDVCFFSATASCTFHSVEITKIYSHWKFFREFNSLVISLVNTLLSRIIFIKSVCVSKFSSFPHCVSTTFKLFYFFDSVERRLGQELFTMKTSPSNGKARLQSSFLYVTASLGEESHLFIKSNDRRIHHSRKVSQCCQNIGSKFWQ